MVFAGITWEGKTNIHFIDLRRAKVYSERYIQLLDDNFLPNCNRFYPRNNDVFQQDGAPSHISRVIQAHLEKATPEFIKMGEWPHQSPDSNSMDCAIWDSLKEKIYREVQDKLTG